MIATGEQNYIVENIIKNHLLVASPGSGKTTTLALKVCKLIQNGANPNKMLILMFGKMPANQFIDKLKSLYVEFGIVAPIPSVLTFHSLANKTLNRLVKNNIIPNFQLINNEFAYNYKLLSALKSCSTPDDFKLIQNSEDKVVDVFRSYVEYTKNKLLDPRISFDEMFSITEQKKLTFFPDAFDKFEEVRLQSGEKFFSDLIRDLVLVLKDNEALKSWIGGKKEHIIIDEFQDTNPAQFELIKHINMDASNLTACGDVDQSIFTFAGADPSIMINSFSDTYSDTERSSLSKTFRFSNRLATLASRVIKHNKLRFDSECVSDIDDTTRCFISTDEDTGSDVVRMIKKKLKEGIPPSQIAILVRVYSDALPIEMALKAADIPCAIPVSSSSLSSNEFKLPISLARIARGDDMKMEPINRVEIYKSLAKFPAKGVSNAVINNAARNTIMKNGDFQFFISQINFDRNLQKFIKAKMFKLIESIEHIKGLYKNDNSHSLHHMMELYMKKTGFLQDLKRNAITAVDLEESESKMKHVTSLFKKNPSIDAVDDFLDFVDNMSKSEFNADGISILSIHKAKGLEWDYVYIPNVNHGNFPYEKKGSVTCIETERRLFYVGITRARKEVYINTLPVPRLISQAHGTNNKNKPISSFAREDQAINFVVETDFLPVEDLKSKGVLPKLFEIKE